MESTIVKADKFGNFTLGPGDQLYIDTWDQGATFPVEVEVDGSRKFTLYDARPLRFSFTELKVTGAKANSQWHVIVGQGGESIGSALTHHRNIRLFDVELPGVIPAGSTYELPGVNATTTFWNAARGSGLLFVAHTGVESAVNGGTVRYYAELRLTPDQKHAEELLYMGMANSHASVAQARTGHIQLGGGAEDLETNSINQQSRRWPGYVRFYAANEGGAEVVMAQRPRVQAWILL